jgi:hypothetical protein
LPKNTPFNFFRQAKHTVSPLTRVIKYTDKIYFNQKKKKGGMPLWRNRPCRDFIAAILLSKIVKSCLPELGLLSSVIDEDLNRFRIEVSQSIVRGVYRAAGLVAAAFRTSNLP